MNKKALLDLRSLNSQDRSEYNGPRDCCISMGAIGKITFVGKGFGFIKVISCLPSFAYGHASLYFRVRACQKVILGVYLPIFSLDDEIERKPQKDDLVIIRESYGVTHRPKGLELNQFWFHDEYVRIAKEMSEWPEYRAMRKSSYFKEGEYITTEPKNIWQGKSLERLREKYPRERYDALAAYSCIEDMNLTEEHWFEKKVGDQWQKCEDPR